MLQNNAPKGVTRAYMTKIMLNSVAMNKCKIAVFKTTTEKENGELAVKELMWASSVFNVYENVVKKMMQTIQPCVHLILTCLNDIKPPSWAPLSDE